MPPTTDIEALRATFQADLERVVNDQDLQTVRDRYLGRKQGALAALMKAMADAPPADRPALGKAANALKRTSSRRSRTGARRSRRRSGLPGPWTSPCRDVRYRSDDVTR